MDKWYEKVSGVILLALAYVGAHCVLDWIERVTL